MSDPFRLPRPAVISFSGGRTSGLMLRRVLDAFGGSLPADVVPIFANTGKERPETLDFVEQVSLEWGVDIVWLEYRRHPISDGSPGVAVEKPAAAWKLDEETDEWVEDENATAVRREVQGGGPPKSFHKFIRVNYATASRNGEPFAQLIDAKAMLPNVAFRYCTQWLKIKVSNRYARHVLGWTPKTGGYSNAIGLRADEPRRVAKLRPDPKSCPGEEPFAPLSLAGVTLADVRAFWAAQPFDLGLMPHEGNCDLCFLKGQGKLVEILRQRPDLADWWIEKVQKFVGKTRLEEAGRFRKNAPSYRQTLQMVQEQPAFDFGGDDFPDCRCTD